MAGADKSASKAHVHVKCCGGALFQEADGAVWCHLIALLAPALYPAVVPLLGRALSCSAQLRAAEGAAWAGRREASPNLLCDFD